jgi:hypothetical protein
MSWVETLLVLNVSEEPAVFICKVEVSRAGMFVGYIGTVEGSGQGKQEDWSVRVMDGGEEIEPCPSK